MQKHTNIIELRISPEDAADPKMVEWKAISKSGIPRDQVKQVNILKRSIDARQSNVKIQLRVEVLKEEKEVVDIFESLGFEDVNDKPVIPVIGAGPAGYFAALECLQKGLKPVIYERGKDVQDRRKDLKAIQQDGVVNPDSNYCFGEGGAGTYSDGKLYTRSYKRGKIANVLALLVGHGAEEDIQVDAHPHIGSNKLPKIIANIRGTIEKYGGEVHFGQSLTDIVIEDNSIKSFTINDEKIIESDIIVLATGHSARDIFNLLDSKSVALEFKPFALGVRVEHPQAFVDSVQYKCGNDRGPYLPAASYALKAQIDNVGVFSFCMCPGGLIIPAATAPGEIVVNGMSLSKRDSPYSNSGVVVEVSQDFLAQLGYKGVFAGVEFQKDVEQSMFNAGDGTQKAPAQRLMDFVRGITSDDLPSSSYIPGLFSAPLHKLLPKEIYQVLRSGLLQFEKKMKGYLSHNAIVVGTESRTSSPIKIPRDYGTLEHIEISGLYPCGEGAGYAGGILSAAMDGQNVVRAIHRNKQNLIKQ